MTTKDLARLAGITDSAMRTRKSRGQDVTAPAMHSLSERGKRGAKASAWSKGSCLRSGPYSGKRKK